MGGKTLHVAYSPPWQPDNSFDQTAVERQRQPRPAAVECYHGGVHAIGQLRLLQELDGVELQKILHFAR